MAELVELEKAQAIPTQTQTQEDKENADAQRKVGDAAMTAKKEGNNIIPYYAISDCPTYGTGIPIKLAYDTVISLTKLNELVGGTTEFVREKLNYTSRFAVCNAFAAEQVDAIACAIYQMEKGKAFIIGDAAGIGKGRICAGLLRYGYHRGLIPAFFTLNGSLYSDIYRDLMSIGGFNGETEFEKLPKPLIINGKSGQKYDVLHPTKKNGESPVSVFSAHKKGDINKILVESIDKGLPKEYKMILGTYSLLGGTYDDESTKNKNKRILINYLSSIGEKCLYIFDESHAASGESFLGSNVEFILNKVTHCVFSSATYAAKPKNMPIYTKRTDLADSSISTETMLTAINNNGEVVQEYIASLLCRSGQYMRRERTFDGCDVSFGYMSDKKKYFAIYDNMISAFNELVTLAHSPYYISAVQRAIESEAKKRGLDIVEKPDDLDDEEQWMSDNSNSYIYKFDNSTKRLTGALRKDWIEMLLFSMKADFVYDSIITELQTKRPAEYIERGEKKTIVTNRKPVIAVSKTAKSQMNRLGFVAGETLTKQQTDFSETLTAIISGINGGSIVFTSVGDSDETIILENYDITPFLSDNGSQIAELKKKFQAMVSGLPLSPIDHILNKIRNTKRKVEDGVMWDAEYTSNPNYTIEEVTGRTNVIVPDEENDDYSQIERFKYVSNRQENSFSKFSRFNNGDSDVILINQAGSTGSSIHSSLFFKDRRPRISIIHQVETNVTTEVQKRGRINRSGQVNKPSYRYVITIVPAETRKMISLARKMRSLDANTSGNMQQSGKISQILASDGKEINDIFNKYGYDAMMDFLSISEPLNIEMKNYYDSLFGKKKSPKEATAKEERFAKFAARLELKDCKMQEEFYVGVNELYERKKVELVAADLWDLDSDVQNLRMATRTKMRLVAGNNTNAFDRDIYLEDKYYSQIVSTIPKDELPVVALKLAQNIHPTVKTTFQGHQELMKEYAEHIEYKVKYDKASVAEPNYDNFLTQEEKDEEKEKHLQALLDMEKETRSEMGMIYKLMQSFVPERSSMICSDIVKTKSEAIALIAKGYSVNSPDDSDWDKAHSILAPIAEEKPAKFIGYKLHAKDETKFRPSNISFIFAPLNTSYKTIELYPTPQGIFILNYLLFRNKKILSFHQAAINSWQIKGRIRKMTKMITGNLLKGFDVAQMLMDTSAGLYSRMQLIQYTLADSSIESGIRLYHSRGINPPLIEDTNQKSINPVNSSAFKNVIENMTDGGRVFITDADFVSKNPDNYSAYKLAITSQKAGSPFSVIKDNKKAKKKLDEMLGTPTKRTRYALFPDGEDAKAVYLEYDVADMNKLTDVFQMLFDEMNLYCQSGDNIFYVEKRDDVPDLEIGGVADEEKGEFAYDLLKRLTAETTPPNVIKTISENAIPPFGGVVLSFKLNPIEAAGYSVTPINPSISNIIKSVNYLLSGAEQQRELFDFIDRNKEDYDLIGEKVRQMMGIDSKYVFGRTSKYKTGEILSANYFVEAHSITGETTTEQGSALPEVHLTSIKEAEDFLINLKQLI